MERRILRTDQNRGIPNLQNTCYLSVLCHLLFSASGFIAAQDKNVVPVACLCHIQDQLNGGGVEKSAVRALLTEVTQLHWEGEDPWGDKPWTKQQDPHECLVKMNAHLGPQFCSPMFCKLKAIKICDTCKEGR